MLITTHSTKENRKDALWKVIKCGPFSQEGSPHTQGLEGGPREPWQRSWELFINIYPSINASIVSFQALLSKICLQFTFVAEGTCPVGAEELLGCRWQWPLCHELHLLGSGATASPRMVERAFWVPHLCSFPTLFSPHTGLGQGCLAEGPA